MPTPVKAELEKATTVQRKAEPQTAAPERIFLRPSASPLHDIRTLRRTIPSNGAPNQIRAILNLQRTIGNRTTGQLLQRLAAPAQPKLSVGPVGDRYEREADAAADRVTASKPVEQLSRLTAAGVSQRLHRQSETEEEEPVQMAGGAPTAQRMCPACEEEAERQISDDDEEPVQTKAGTEGPEFDTAAAERAMAKSGSGNPLGGDLQGQMEGSFGMDFSGVRVHTGPAAQEANRAINARAFTHGSDIYLGRGESATNTRLMAHELTHVVQQRGLPPQRPINPILGLNRPVLQRDLARPPRGAGAPLRALTPEEILAAITTNQNRFSDPYSIRVIRDVLGLEPVPAVIDEEFVRAVTEWQAERRMTQDGLAGHRTTRSIYLELVAEGQFRDAILLIMDSYHLPGSLRLNDVRVGGGANCCGAGGGGADAVTSGGPHCGGGPINICFCRLHIPRTTAEYDHFVRITGHELIHVPQCATGTGNVDVDEFEAFFWEACARGRAPQLSAAERVNHASIALGHFAHIPPALRTPARVAMRNQLNILIGAGGAGPC